MQTTNHATPSRISAEPSSLWFRLLAMIYDLFPLAALWFTGAALMLLLRGGVPVTPNSGSAFLEFAALLALSFGYLGISWKRGGQTLGMRAWRLRLVDSQGAALVSWKPLVIRFLVALISFAACGLGFFWSLIDRDRRTLHDIVSGTSLVRLPKPSKK